MQEKQVKSDSCQAYKQQQQNEIPRVLPPRKKELKVKSFYNV